MQILRLIQEIRCEVAENKVNVISSEVSIPRLMESHHYRYHFANGEARRLVSLFDTGRN